MRSIHLPVWFGSVKQRRAATFASLFAIFTFLRALLVTVVPLNAREILGSVEFVSYFYFGVSIVGIAATFSLPWLVHKFRRRWVFSIGALASVSGSCLMATQTFSGLLIGMALHVLAVAIIEITFNLYVMDHIPREDLSHFEPLRMLVMALPWAVAPWLGVFLRGNLSPLAPFLLAALCALILFGYFWYLRLSDDPAVSPAKGPPPSAFKNIRRFVSQPRLLLAWSLAVGRSSWWVLFFVYGPLFAVESGLSEETAGLIASIGAGSLFAVPLWAWVGRRIGLRKLMMIGYGASAFFSILVLSGVGIPFAIAVLLVLSAYATGIIDAAGNLPFLRGVHHWERPEMTSVFATYRDFSQLAPPGVFSLVLRIFPLQSLFVICGCSMLVLAFFCRYLPRRL